MTRYERYVIRPILKAIEKHQDSLCQPENLPQLAKLGFMFEKLWYAGRVAYGFNGIAKKGNSCENNPKYELGDTIEYNSEENENLIYDAWGMHVSNDINQMDFQEFQNLVLNGRQLSEFEIRCRKPDKTFDEWVEIMTNEQYGYRSLFPNKRSVANYLLCTIGTGYGYNKTTGLVFREASGADQDIDLYGDWENSKLIPAIQKVIDKVLAFDMTKIALDTESTFAKKLKAEHEEKMRKEKMESFGRTISIINKMLVEQGEPEIDIDNPKFDEILDNYLNTALGYNNRKTLPDEEYEYYPLSNYSIITMFDENTHPSYINAGIEICKHIVKYPPKIRKNFNQYQIDQRNDMIKFAEDFLTKFKVTENII